VHYKSLKTVNQSLKHKVNRCVLSLRLNECKLSASRTAAGRLPVVNKDLQRMGLTWEEVEASAQDRQTWRQRVALCIGNAG